MVLACATGVKEAGPIVHQACMNQTTHIPGPSTQRPRRGLRWRAYRLVRPIVRPIAWRLRSFFVGRVHDELVELRAQVEALRASVDMLRAQVEHRAAEQREALAPTIMGVMEQALLTIALDREVDREDKQR